MLLDDGSRDHTGEVLRKHADRFLRTEDIWETRANNAAMELATGDFVAILQDDDLPLAMDWMDVMVETMNRLEIDVLSGRPFGAWHYRANPRTELFEDALLPINKSEFIGLTLKPSEQFPSACCLDMSLRFPSYDDAKTFEVGVYEAECVIRSPFIVSRRVWEQCGPFDTAFAPLTLDDYDFCFRAREAGFRIAFTNLPKRVHFGGGSHWLYKGGDREQFFAEVCARNENTFLRRHALKFRAFTGPEINRLGSIEFRLDRNLIEAIEQSNEATMENEIQTSLSDQAVETIAPINVLKEAIDGLSRAADVPAAVRAAAAAYSGSDDRKSQARVIIIETAKECRYEHFGVVLDLIRVHEADFVDDAEVMHRAGFVAWVQRSSEECIRWAQRVVSMAPTAFNGYLRLGMNGLSQQRPMDAFLAFSAGINNAENAKPLMLWWRLSEHLAQGKGDAVFEKWGHRFRFRLSCFSTQAVEADAIHVDGRFTEEAELAYLSQVLKGCEHLLEVGTLVGNHSVCLATMVEPKTLRIVDANDRSIEETHHNLSLNRESYPRTKISFLHAALAGPETSEVTIEGKTVKAVTLEAILVPEIDFVKIDVDGMEAELLEPLCRLLPDRNCRLMIEVENPMKPGFVEKMLTIGYCVKHEFVHEDYTNLFFVPPRVEAR